jgi:3-hydroxyisobutyrate dehydrogenase-like beta-hydroxyacid dehydrogenase
MDVGFVGLGSMGSRIADLLLGAGHHLTVWARRGETLEPYHGRADEAPTPRDVARHSDMVGICVWAEDDVDQVLLRDDGILAGMRPGGVVVVHSTISPGGCRRLEREALARGSRLIDAPVSAGANLPKVLMLVGGDEGAVEYCRPALEAAADPLVRLGPIGSGQIAKLVHNTLVAASIGLADDAIGLGRDLGMDPTALGLALASGAARGTWSTFVNRPPSPVPRERHTTDWARKDVGYALQVAAEQGASVDRMVFRLAERGVGVVER